jgi:hypothetical protein
MLLRNRLHDSQSLISAGMACLAVGIVTQRFIHPPTDFWQGFVAGFSGMLIGLSIVFNLRGLMLRRRHHDIGR